MGWLDSIAGAYLTSRSINASKRPQISVPDGYVLKGLYPKGLSKWVVKFSKTGSSSTSEFVISNTARSYTGGWKFFWN